MKLNMKSLEFNNLINIFFYIKIKKLKQYHCKKLN